jgi:hypothetical protein
LRHAEWSPTTVVLLSKGGVSTTRNWAGPRAPPTAQSALSRQTVRKADK